MISKSLRFGSLPDLEDRNLLKLRSRDSSCPFFLSDKRIWGQWSRMLQMLLSQGYNSLQDLQMLKSLREETEGKLQMLLSPRKHGLDSLFNRKNPHAHKNKISTSTPPLPKKTRPPPPKTRNFMGMGFCQQKEPKMPGAHKIGAAISGHRIAGRKIMGARIFLI